jgi:SAM-dependent methyltransferase
MHDAQDHSSYGRTRVRFDTSLAASKYAARETNGHRLRESQCVRAALSHVPPASRVLDLPCGAGYLIRTLVDAGFYATGADVSQHMLDRARAAWAIASHERPEWRGKARFLVQDIMQTSFPDGHFDAVVCNRLFHHFYEPAMRCAALAELRRICSGPVVVFYFDRFALDAIRLASLRAIFGKFRRDRIPISTKTFAAEAASVGLQMEKVIWTRWGISPQAFAIFRPIHSGRHASRRLSVNPTARIVSLQDAAAPHGPHFGNHSGLSGSPQQDVSTGVRSGCRPAGPASCASEALSTRSPSS